MATTSTNLSKSVPNLYLSPKEQDLLLTALNSSKPAMSQQNQSFSNGPDSDRPNPSRSQSNSQQFGQGDIHSSPIQQTPGSASLRDLGFDDSPFLDYEGLDDGNFDWDISADQMIGSLPGTSHGDEEEGDLHDKRKSPGDDQEEDDRAGKRQEGDDKTSKKPGRKPLTSEPTSKRKAQNRAAQRAFRERKEKHLKELETKVDDLEKASESANHENGLLRAEVDRLQTELKEYRKRLSMNTSLINRTSPLQTMQRSSWNINNNFQFEFPKFGELPSPAPSSKLSPTHRLSSGSPSYNGTNVSKPIGTLTESPKALPNSSYSIGQNNLNNFGSNAIGDLSSLFSPSILDSVSRHGSGDYLSFGSNVNNPQNQVNSTDSQGYQKGHRAPSVCTTASPSASSISHNGLNSSTGTTPEPCAASPGPRKASEGDNGNTRRDSEGEIAFCKMLGTACGTKDNPIPQAMNQSNQTSSATSIATPSNDLQGFDWLAQQTQQNGGAFDPILFSDYRDPQETIMNFSGDNFSGDFFNDAFPDFMGTSGAMLDTTLPKKKDLVKEMDKQADKEDEVVPGGFKQFLTCNMLWDRMQRSQKVQSGEADMDDLCLQLKAKAKCSGSGAVIEQKDVDAILGPPPKDHEGYLSKFK